MWSSRSSAASCPPASCGHRPGSIAWRGSSRSTSPATVAPSTFDLDLSLSHGFRQLVQRHLPAIGYGQTRSYGEVAMLVGNPKAVRAVGTACATNPLPVVVPCHRVLRADGSLGGYIGGAEAKSTLLHLEAA
ncbi:MGMT family protein [Nocardioides soli]